MMRTHPHPCNTHAQVLLRADGQLETVGRVRLSGPEEVGAYAGVFTAHPKVDPLTGEGHAPTRAPASSALLFRLSDRLAACPGAPRAGECFFFGYDMMDKPWMRAGLLDAQGQLTKQASHCSCGGQSGAAVWHLLLLSAAPCRAGSRAAPQQRCSRSRAHSPGLTASSSRRSRPCPCPCAVGGGPALPGLRARLRPHAALRRAHAAPARL